MISVPLSAIVAALLGFLLCLLVTRRDRRFRSIILFLTVGFALMVLVSLRWSSDATVFRLLQPMLAAFLPPAAWLCFSGLKGGAPGRVWPHFLPGLALLVLTLLGPRHKLLIDAVLTGLFFGYGGALIWRGLQGEASFAATRLGGAVQPGRAAVFVGVLLLLAGAIDLIIAFDFRIEGGARAGLIVSAGNMVMLPLIAWAALAVARSLPESEDIPEPEIAARPDEPDPPGPDDDRILSAIEKVLGEQRLYRDPDLTLERLARRVGIPGRQISQAINRRNGRNVSQEINQWRIREAMELLEKTDRAVTEIMFDCGFQTKSNFNNTFRRLTGLSPSDWRRRAKAETKDGLNQPKASDPETH